MTVSEHGEFAANSGTFHWLAKEYLDSLLRGDRHAAGRAVMDAVGNGTSVRDIYLYVFQPSQYEIGRLWQHNLINVAQEHFCTACTQFIMSQLYPSIFNGEKNGRRVVMTCVSGELHEIGARMVADFFEMEGWDSYYLGANTPSRSIIETIAEQKADVIGISTSIHFNVVALIELVGEIRASCGASSPKIIVGGRPFNLAAGLWQKVGADGSAGNAREAIRLAKELVYGAKS